MNKKNMSIGFFDSGVGGISVLKEAIKLLPYENFIYYGDSKNAPYGTKTVTEVKALSIDAANYLLDKGVKAIVVACNTATSAAIDHLRSKYPHIPVIGIEPALKPAVELNRPGKIIVMATPMTLAEQKFKQLMKQYEEKSKMKPLPCPQLVELIQNGIVSGEEMRTYLTEKLKKYLDNEIATIVLGCTHYPFVKKEISKLVGHDVPIIDGGEGTAKQLKRKLICNNLLNDTNKKGTVHICDSSCKEELIELGYKLLYL